MVDSNSDFPALRNEHVEIGERLTGKEIRENVLQLHCNIAARIGKPLSVTAGWRCLGLYAGI